MLGSVFRPFEVCCCWLVGALAVVMGGGLACVSVGDGGQEKEVVAQDCDPQRGCSADSFRSGDAADVVSGRSADVVGLCSKRKALPTCGSGRQAELDEVVAYLQAVGEIRCELVGECCGWSGFQQTCLVVVGVMTSEYAAGGSIEGRTGDCAMAQDCAAALTPCSCEDVVARYYIGFACGGNQGEEPPTSCQYSPIVNHAPDSCRLMFRGPVADGESCVGDSDCGGSSVCQGPASAKTAGMVCGPLASVGEACVGDTSCGQDLLCLNGKCLHPGNEGDACEGSIVYCEGVTCRVGKCAGGLQCVDGICTPMGSLGDSCQLSPPVFCTPEYYCNGSQCSLRLPAGVDCIPVSGYSGLNDPCEGRCESETLTCVEKASFGEDCSSDHDCLGNHCHPKGSCYYPALDGIGDCNKMMVW